ncbi:hypothetical protein H1R20_g15405, partial [Candolleomyces eurysporus]
MPSKSSVRRQKHAPVGHRHRVQVQNATDALSSPMRRSPVAQSNQPVAGPSSPSYMYGYRDRRALIVPSPDRRVLFSPPPTRQRLVSPPPLNRRALPSSPPTFTNPFYTPGGTPSLMELDGQSERSGSTFTDRMSVTPDVVVPRGGDHSDGSSTVVPMDFHHPHPQLPLPQNTYFVTAVDLDNLRNAIHFMHHAVVLVDTTLNTLWVQNPHCPYFRRA